MKNGTQHRKSNKTSTTITKAEMNEVISYFLSLYEFINGVQNNTQEIISIKSPTQNITILVLNALSSLFKHCKIYTIKSDQMSK